MGGTIGRSVLLLLALVAWVAPARAADPFDPARGIHLRGTVVTMDDAGTEVPDGNHEQVD